MNGKKYSYLPNKYTIKFFEISNKEQSNFFRPLLITENYKNRTNDVDINRKELKLSKNKNKLIDIPQYNKKNDLLIKKRKKAINAYLKVKTNINNKSDKENKKYINNNYDSFSSLSISKAFNNNHIRVYHSFQNSKIKKKKSNIISQIKNKENGKKNKQKLNYSKTDKDFYTIKKEEKNSILKESFDKNIKNIEKKFMTTNSIIIKNNSENEIIPKLDINKTAEKKRKIKNIYIKDISLKDNYFNTCNCTKNNNIKVLKPSLNNKSIEAKIFKPNMNIFKNTSINNKKLSIQLLTEKNMNINHISKNNDYKSPINIKKINYRNGIISSISTNKEKEDNKNDSINNYQQSNNYSGSYVGYNHPLNITENYKSPLNSEYFQFTFKKKDVKKDNNKNSILITEKRRNELNKLINFTNQF